MLQLLNKWWGHNHERRHDQSLELTVTRLMVSMMHMDDHDDRCEHDEIIRLIRKRFDLDEDEAERLFVEALHAEPDCPHFAQVAEQINRNYDRLEVAMLLSDIWRVAEADGNIDFYEERYISRLASLLKVPTEVVREAKLHRKAA